MARITLPDPPVGASGEELERYLVRLVGELKYIKNSHFISSLILLLYYTHTGKLFRDKITLYLSALFCYNRHCTKDME